MQTGERREGSLRVGQALRDARAALAASSPSPGADADALLGHVLARDRAYLYAHPEHPVDPDGDARLAGLLRARARGVPVAHLTGWREFWSLRLAVDAHTLIPRPETEVLVERALAHLEPGATARVADLGTGCGAIAIAIASERPRAEVVAIDRSRRALAVAAANAARHGLTGIRFDQGHWYRTLAGDRFDLLVSNPPYVGEADPHLGRGDLRFEPREALVSGPDGLHDLRALASGARGHLVPGAVVALEHGHDQAAEVRQMLGEAGLVEVRSFPDLAGRERVTEGRAPRGPGP